MQFYPHNTPIISVANAVSASIANTGSLINNFSAITINIVNTASVALNITGSPGTAGTNLAVIGPTGNTGLRGETGYRGNSIFLLSGSWNTDPCSAPVVCYGGFTLQNVGPNIGECGSSQGSAVYYSNFSGQLTASIDPYVPAISDNSADNSILYTDSSCTAVASNVSVHNGSRIFYTDGAGVISSTGCTS